jgi:hypothetical protein
MSGKRLIILMAVGIILTSTIMYALYFATRQLDYISPSENSGDPPLPYAMVTHSPMTALISDAV